LAADDPGSQDRFLKLLITQIQNQDPLSPMDNAQVTSQIAQINTVSGIQQLNTTVKGLSGQFTQLQALQSANLVGRDVVVPGNVLDIASGVGQGGFELSGPADAVKVEVLSPSGQVVGSMALGALGSGSHSFNWPAGSATNDGGLRFRVTASSGAVNSTPTTLMRDRVNAINTSGNSLNLELQNAGSVPYSSVRALN
jgi:flagellar basal-body rod modification protein FlgD